MDVVTSDLEKGNLNDCLDIIGESPLKFPSKITPTYVRAKIAKAQSTLKRKLQYATGQDDSESSEVSNLKKSINTI